MKIFKHTAAILVLILTMACQKETLTSNQVYQSKDLTIEFKDYTDSRCPNGATCFWEGEAEVYLEAISNGNSVSFYLTGLGADTTVFGHHVELVDLLPYPENGVADNFEDKEVVLKVSKF